MKRIILFMLLIVSSMPCFSQNIGSISGNIIDSATNEVIEFANLSLFDAKDNSLIQGTVTDMKGNFSLENIPFGDYKLKISFVGYQDKERNISLSENNKIIRLNKISLTEDSKLLNEVEVVDVATQMRFDIDKKVFMVNQNLLSAGVGTDEILRNIPSVNVDNDGNISLRNDENVQVWINGKPSGLTTDNRAQILEQLPAESVESVEIITNPSAKYNPEGTSGIINIILKKDRRGGYYGNVSAGVSRPFGLSLGGNLNYSNKKIDTYINLSYRKNKRIGGGSTDRMSYADGDTTYLQQENESTNRHQGMFLRTGIDYHINSKNTIGISGFGMLGKGENNTDYDYLFRNNIFETIEKYSQNTFLDRDNKGFNLSLDYKLTFDKKDHELTANVGYSSFKNESQSDYVYEREISNSIRKEISDRHNSNYNLQLDYILPITDRTKFEAGYKSSIAPDNSFVSLENIENGISVPKYTDDFSFERQIHSVYAIYKGKINTWGYQAGLRGEQTVTDWENLEGSGNSSHFDLFPSFFLSKTFNETHEVQLSATRRINRPGRWRLNPFRNTSDSTNISYGNPDLKPEYSWAYELSYIKTWQQHSVSSSLYYRHADDVVQSISTLIQDGNSEYIETTFDNIASRKNAGFEFTLKNRFLSIIELTSMFNGYYSKLSGSEEYDIKEREDFSWDARMIANILIKKGFSTQLTGNYRAPSLTAQGKRLESYSLDFGIRKIFFQKLNVNLSVRDILDSRKNKSETFGKNFYQKTERYRQGRNVSLTLSYNFGNLKPKNGKKQRTENFEEEEL